MDKLEYGLLGAHLSYSFSPQIHKALGGYNYGLFEKKEKEIEDFLKNKDLKGINITIPYKKTVMKYCDEISPIGLRIGAINTIKFQNGKLYGDNTDYYGIIYMLERANINISGKKVAILGDGATSQTIKVVLEDLNVKEIKNISRKGSIKFSEIEKYNDIDIIINATPVGMYPGESISLVNLDDFPKLEAVVDIVYNPARTKLILDGLKKGLKTATGLAMLVGQAKKAVEIFLGKVIDDENLESIYREIFLQTQNIALIGMPGSGKTSIGKLLSKNLNREFIDIDLEIERREKMSIPSIFEKYGEKYFREIEKEITKEISKKTGIIISTGGGVVLDYNNYDSLKQNSYIVLIERDLKKLSTKGRPLSQGGIENLKKLQKKRQRNYEYFADMKVENIYIINAVDEILGGFYENSCN